MTKKELLQFLDDTVITFCEMDFMPLTVCPEPEEERDKFEDRLLTVETEIKKGTAEERIAARALDIASKLMAKANFCRWESAENCKRLYVDQDVCAKCIKTFLATKARKELKQEAKGCKE